MKKLFMLMLLLVFIFSCDYIKNGKVIGKDIIYEKYYIDINKNESSTTSTFIDSNGFVHSNTTYYYEGTYFTEYFYPRNYKITVEGYSVRNEKLIQESFFLSDSDYDNIKIGDYIDVRNSDNKFIYSKFSPVYKKYKTNSIYIDKYIVDVWNVNTYFNNIILPDWLKNRKEGKIK